MESVSKSWQAVTQKVRTQQHLFWLRKPSESCENKFKVSGRKMCAYSVLHCTELEGVEIDKDFFYLYDVWLLSPFCRSSSNSGFFTA